MADVMARLRAAGCVFAEDEARLLLAAAATDDQLDELVRRRVGGEPLEYILGWVEFCGLRIAVEPGVFVPRRRTEFLAREAIALVRDGAVLVDLCCGCGAVAAAVSAACPAAAVYAADLDPVAVACAHRNLGERVYAGDLYDALPDVLRGGVAVIVANAPYVPTEALATMPPEARLYEPTVALDGGPDGLDVLRRVISGAPDWLLPGGHLLVESSTGQAERLTAAMARAGLLADIRHSDEADGTLVAGVRPATARHA
jgi:release factor glutamine methyltransferase